MNRVHPLILLATIAGCEPSSRAERSPILTPDVLAASVAPEPVAVERAHTDHQPRHGGLVMMHGELHFEVVLDPRGSHAVYFTDATRKDVPPSRVQDLTITLERRGAHPEVLPATPVAGGHFTAKGRSLLGSELRARVAYAADGDPYAIDLPIHRDKHAAGPHGGITTAVDGGLLELVALPSGAIKVWLLDHGQHGLPLPRARVQVAQADYAELALAPDGDHLAGTGAPIVGAHPTITVLLADHDATRFTLHHGHAHGHHHDHGHHHHHDHGH